MTKPVCAVRRAAALTIPLLLASFASLPRARAAGAALPLDVAYAGSMGAVMNGPIRAQAAHDLGVDVRGRGQGALALASLIVGGSLHPDVFIAVTPEPMERVLAAGMVPRAVPIARTAMVVAYSPKSRFAPLFVQAGRPGQEPWWQILESPGLRLGRTDPRHDPQGRNFVFMLDLASRHYRQPNLRSKLLGSLLNPAQVFPEATVMARLQSGELDAASAYRTQPAVLGLPYVILPEAINLGSAAKLADYRAVSETFGGHTQRPSPLVFYAAALQGSAHPKEALAFVHWLRAPRAQRILRQASYDAPGDTPELVRTAAGAGGPGHGSRP
ncbi:MAG: extracellular solute-binding protein [Cyanobacteria bacterium REEB65]|nr:extracellular solute-binding protein [Cyanobacteria bacterium REEB65]